MLASKRVAVFAVLAMAGAVSYAIYVAFFEVSWRAVVAEPARMFEEEMHVAYPGTRIPEAYLTTLAMGDLVDVLYDTHGKDYWACYVRTESDQEGWVLCTDLKKIE